MILPNCLFIPKKGLTSLLYVKFLQDVLIPISFFLKLSCERLTAILFKNDIFIVVSIKEQDEFVHVQWHSVIITQKTADCK